LDTTENKELKNFIEDLNIKKNKELKNKSLEHNALFKKIEEILS
jgi:hypothetical protein